MKAKLLIPMLAATLAIGLVFGYLLMPTKTSTKEIEVTRELSIDEFLATEGSETDVAKWFNTSCDLVPPATSEELAAEFLSDDSIVWEQYFCVQENTPYLYRAMREYGMEVIIEMPEMPAETRTGGGYGMTIIVRNEKGTCVVVSRGDFYKC